MTTHSLRARRCASIACFVAFCSAPDLHAQAPLNGGSSTIAWPNAVTGAPTRSISGDFTGDHVTDAVFLTAGGGATLAYGPGTYSAFVHLPSDIRDAARVRGSPGTSDRLLVVDGTGLRILSDYDAGAFTVTSILAGAPWSSARRILTGHADSDLLLDAVGLAADGRTILVASNFAGASPSVSSFTMAQDVHDLRIVAWSPEPAVVVLTTAGIHVRRASGAVVVEYVGGTFASGALVEFEQSGLAHQRVAAVYSVPGNGDFLGVVDKNGPAQITPLGAIGAYALASGDVDADGKGDLVLLQRANHYALLLKNQGGSGAPFGTVGWVNLGLGTQAAPTQTAFPVLADLTNDGDLDLLVHVDATDVLVAIENSSVAHANAVPTVVAGQYTYSFDADAGDLQLEVVPGFSAHPFVPTGIEVVVWAQDPLTGTSATAVHHEIFDIGTDGRAFPLIPIAETDVATSHNYHVVMQCVRVVGGATVAAGPSAVWTFATPTADVEALELAAGTEGVQLRIYLLDEERFMTLAEEDERVLTPSTVPLPKVPPIDEPPDPFDP